MSETIHIFLPVYFREETVRKASEAVLQTYRSDGYNVRVVFVDNRSNDSLRVYLKGLESRCKDVSVILLDKNEGKAEAIMKAAKMYPDFDWFINCDSDILPVKEGWPGILAACYARIENAGMISPSYVQNGNNPMPAQPEMLTVDVGGKKYTYRWGSAVAGGCFITDVKMWRAIEYRGAQGVYGGVDGVFRQRVADIYRRKCGYIEEVQVEHLDDREKNAGYHQWKISVQGKIKVASPFGRPEVLGNQKGYWDT